MDSTSTSNTSGTGEIPFILQGSYFEVLNLDKATGKISAACQECKKSNKSKTINGYLHPTSNFVSHLKVCHATTYEKYQAQMKEPGRKLKVNKQTILPFERVVTSSKVLLAEKLITDYLVESIIPLSTVENPAFKALVQGLCDGAKVPSPKRLKTLISERHNSKVDTLKNKLNAAEFCCVTADIWSNHHRSFFEATVHWINNNLHRESSVLVLSRFTGTHDYERLTEVMLQTFERFDISREKITCVVTDNGSNFVKAFKENGISTAEGNEPDDDAVDVELMEMQNLLPALPAHERCASHTLSLIATTDLENANIVTPRGPENFKRVFRATLAKCNAIWNAAGRSVKVAEQIHTTLGKSLIQPNATRWNFLFDAIRRLLEYKEKIADICAIVAGVQNFTAMELELLAEYIQALQPIAFALDKLQGDKSFYFGYKLPVLLKTKKRLHEIIEAKRKFATPLAKALLAGLEKRFQPELDLSLQGCSSAVFASISFPFFKLRWIPQEHQETLKTAFIAEAKSMEPMPAVTSQTKTNSTDADDKFFEFEESQNSNQNFANTVEL